MTTDHEALEREQFEKWISAPPFEKDISRYSDRHVTWPNCYKDYQVHLAWDAWKAALSAQGGEQSAEMVSMPREIDRNKHAAVLAVWNDCMMNAETLEMTWPKLVNAMLAAEKEGK